jgi:uncharacterized membrane protein YbhN (UPF0104 family)
VTHYFFQPGNAEQFLRAISSLNEFPLLWLILVVMSVINWSLEAWKWKILLAKHDQISFLRSFAAVWAGVAFGLFTPNRTGEFVGRILFVNKKPEAAGATIFGNIAQLGITLLMGLAALIFSNEIWTIDLLGIGIQLNFVSWLGLALIVYIMLLWNFWKRVAQKLKGKIAQILSHLFTGFDRKQMLAAWSLSFVRYLVFWFQFILVLSFLSSSSLGDIIWTVPLTYLLQAVVPSFAFAEIGVRAFSISTIFAWFQLPPESAIIASLLIWMINVIFPAMCGAFLVYFSDHEKTLNGQQ